MAKRVGGRGSAPDPAGGAYEETRTLPDPTPLSAFGASILAPSALDSNFAPSALNFGVPIVVTLRNDHCCVLHAHKQPQ